LSAGLEESGASFVASLPSKSWKLHINNVRILVDSTDPRGYFPSPSSPLDLSLSCPRLDRKKKKSDGAAIKHTLTLDVPALCAALLLIAHRPMNHRFRPSTSPLLRTRSGKPVTPLRPAPISTFRAVTSPLVQNTFTDDADGFGY
jgi:hypothetical protein